MIQSVHDTLLHVRFQGRSYDVPLADLDIGAGSTDRQIREALAGYLKISQAKLVGYVIDRHSTGNMTIRPPAVFG